MQDLINQNLTMSTLTAQIAAACAISCHAEYSDQLLSGVRCLVCMEIDAPLLQKMLVVLHATQNTFASSTTALYTTVKLDNACYQTVICSDCSLFNSCVYPQALSNTVWGFSELEVRHVAVESNCRHCYWKAASIQCAAQ